jgi:bifunctional DNA-binding transcriptional regulator/antitoxin component of YhaV-PrlF toxin-antitoxin module
MGLGSDKMSQLAQVSLDDQGRLLIPATIKNQLGLTPGMTLIVEEADKDGVRLHIQSEPPTLVDEGGILVVQAEPLEDLSDIVQHERNRRVFDLLQREGL